MIRKLIAWVRSKFKKPAIVKRAPISQQEIISRIVLQQTGKNGRYEFDLTNNEYVWKIYETRN